jgi:hypothetical protein
MNTLQNAMRADERIGSFGNSLSSVCREIAQGALQSVGHFYGYGVFDKPSTPKVELESKDIVAGLNAICDKVRDLETQSNRVVITADMGHQLEVIFRHLPDTVAREGWSAALIDAVSRACKDIVCFSPGDQDTPVNLLYHSAVGGLVQLDSIPPAIAYPMLRMVTQWKDLERIALAAPHETLSTPYWISTLEIGQQAVRRVSEGFREIRPEETLDVQKHRLSVKSAAWARETLANAPLVAKLLSA